MVILGLGSFALNLVGFEFKLLMWVDMWGSLVGNLIRASCVLVGAVLLYISLKKSAPTPIESYDDVRAREEGAPFPT